MSLEGLTALEAACELVEFLSFPPTDTVGTLRKQGYITIVSSGVHIALLGLERLRRDRDRVCSTKSKVRATTIG
jgi:hypothetical protein